MLFAAKMATFRRVARRALHHFLALVIAVSTLSAISVSTASATARTVGSGACSQAYTFNSGADAVSVIEDGGFCYVAFRNTAAAGSVSSSYSWTKPAGVTSLNVLVVGGGGGGGARHGGGGGAGSYVEAIGLAAPSIATSINVIVGAGGIGAAGGSSPFVGAGAKGSPSSFRIGTTNGLVARGGGAGINGSDVNIVDGGSGGGAGANQTAGEAIRSTQSELQSATEIAEIEFVNVGAPGASDPNSGLSDGPDFWAAGGGGGAGESGKRPTFNNVELSGNSFSNGTGAGTRGGNGGVGKKPNTNTLSASLASQLSVGHVVSGQVYFAGGGGGGMGADGVAGGIGGDGGGGNGTKAVSTGGVAGLPSTGGGGGGSGFDDSSPVAGDVANPPGGAGGSGVVVIRYAATYTVTYNYNSATGGNSTTSSTFTTGGNAITLPTPTRTGYTFGGWFVASDFSGSALGSTYSPTSSLTINAKWNAKVCTLTDVSNSGFTTVTFTSVQDCVWTIPSGVTAAEVLVVGGGGGGGANVGSGGAGGGVYYNNNLTLTPGASSVITVGAGGSAGNFLDANNTINVNQATNAAGTGGTSSIGTGSTTITSVGGGGGGTYWGNSICVGSGTAGAATNNNGGSNGGSLTGRGGAGGASSASSGNNGAAGGAGQTLTFGGGSSTIYGAGGGGGAWSATGGTGGGSASSGAGNGASTSGTAGAAGTTNRGGGGGGGSLNCAAGGAGGSGVVIVRYINAPSISLSTSTINATVGSAVTSYSITSSGGPVASYAISPALTTNGTLAFNTTTGVISGTPTNTLSATSYTITATNTSGTTTSTFSLAINHVSCSPTTNPSPPAGYTVLTFTNTTTCNWSVPTGVTAAEILVVGGGGGAGSGGGGAGGFLSESRTGLSGVIQIVVGSGGAQSAGENLRGANGGTSSFGDRSAGGGGGGGRGTAAIGSDAPTGATQRGSGGGASSNGSAGKSAGATRGGDTNDGRNIGGGGGGAGADGVGNNSGAISGNGGVGLQSSISGTSTYYAGGGRAAGGGSGGLGHDKPGGGGSNTGSTAGQDGVVIVRYANSLTITYDTQSGSAIASGSTTTGGSISTSPGTPTRTGYTFNGWFTASTGGTAITFPYTHNQTANFTLYAQWSQIINGSMLFGANTNSYITIPNSAGLKFGTGQFTVEWWQYQTDSQLYPRVFESLAATTREIGVSIESNTFYWWSGGSALCRQDLGTGNKNAWLHFAVSRSGSTTKVFKNGTEICSFTDSKDYQPTGVLKIGSELLAGANTYFGGNITNFHWVKGTALYTANFTKNLTPTTTNANSILLLNSQNQSTFTTDLTGLNTVTNNGNNVTWSTMSPFGASSVATLSALSLSTGTLSPTFASGTTSYTASVSNATSSITVTPTVTQANATIQAKVGSGSFASVTSASASGSLALAVGSNTITVLVTAQDGTTTATYTVTVTRGVASQTITFGSLNNKTLGSGTYAVSATASSSLAVTLTSATPLVCTISSGTITLVAAGTCTINANQAGDSSYAAATQVQQSFTVSSALSITTPSGSGLQGNYNSEFSLTISASGGAGSNTFTATGDLPTGVSISSAGVISGTPSTAGNFSLTVTVTDANSATATTSSFTIAIVKGTSTVSLTIPSFTFTGSPQGPDSVTKTGSTGNVTYAYAGRGSTTYASSSTKPTNVGTYTVTATVAADSNFASVSASGDFAITNASLVITPTISASSMVFGTSSGLPTISHSKNPNVTLTTDPTCTLHLASDTSFTTARTINSSLAVGSYVVRCTGAVLTNYTITYGTNPSFSVTKADQAGISSPVLSATSKTFPYSQTSLSVNSVTGGSGDGALSITSVVDGTATGCTWSGSTLTSSTSGTCTLTITKAASASYEAATATATFTFNKATPTFNSWSNVTKSYSDTFTVTSPVVVGSVSGTFSYSSATTSVISVSGTTLSADGVGTSVITATFTPTSTTDYNTATTTMTVTVNKASQTMAWTPTTSLLVTDSPVTFAAATALDSAVISYQVTSAGTTGCTVNSSTRTLTFTAAGSCTVLAQAAATDRYILTSISQTFTITLATRTLTIDSGSFASTYGMLATPPTLTSTASAGTGTKSYTSSTTSVCTVNSSSGLVAFVAPGTCTLAASIAATSAHSSATASSVSFAITSSTATLSALVLSSGTLDPTFASATTTYTASVANSVATGFTVTPTTTQANATTVQYLGATGTTAFTGALSVGANVIRTVVTAQDGTTTSTYTVTVTRALETYTITLGAGTNGTGSNQTFTKTNGTNLTLPDSATANGYFTRTGYTVSGWSTSDGGSQTHALGGSLTTEAATTLYPVWTDIAATVYFLADDYTAGSTTWTERIANAAGTTATGGMTKGTSPTSVVFAGKESSNSDRLTGSIGSTTGLSAVTVEMWVRLGDNGSTQNASGSMLFSWSSNTGTGNYNIYHNSSKLGFNTFNSELYGINSATHELKWRHYVFVMSTGAVGTQKIYVNGVLQTLSYQFNTAMGTRAFNASGNFVVMDNPIAANTWNAKGNLGLLRVYRGELNGAQAASLYDTTKSTYEFLTVAYDSQGGTAVSTASTAVGGSIATAPTPPTRTGYTFAGWSTTPSGSAISFTGGYTHGQSADFTLYALWTAGSLVVTYDAKGGTSVSNGSTSSGASISAAPTAPTRTGYTLDGWSATDGGTVVTFPYAHGQTANFTLYAKWTGTTNTITYDSKSGSSVANGSFVTGGSIASAPTAPTRAGYSLTGWSLTDSGSVITYPYSPVATSGITLYAIWAAISCSPTSTTAGGYTIYTFTTAGTCFWTVPDGVTGVELFAVAGGGGGGYAWDNAGAGGGAGGQVKTGTATLSTTLEVTVGAGGSAGIVSSTRGGSGGNSSVSAITALGGTGGCGARATTCSNSAQATSSDAANGGVGGAGGASGRGGGGSNTTGSLTSTTAGGVGTASSFSGTSVTYGVGGAGGTARSALTNIVGTAGSANTGNGGGGASAKSSSGQVNGGAGGSGLVIVRVASPLTVTYDSQSGSEVTAGSTVTGGSIATPPTDPTRANYTFLGWFTATTGGSAISFPYAHGQTANFTLYARWTLNSYAITFNTNNGTGLMGNQTFTHGVAFNLNANLYTRANYVFHRWATNADGTGTTYNNLAQVTLTAATTLYAQWTANTYVVTYNYNEATGGNSTTTASFTTAGSAIVLPTPTKTGFTFAGWYSDSGLSSSIGSAGANYSPTGATLSLNAYAKWTAVNYTFTYDSNSADSGSVPTETSKQITQTATVKANTGALVRAGYTFGGWNTQSNGSGDNYLSGSLFTVGSSNVTLYAKWTANTYTITYNVNGGTGNAQRTVSSVATNVTSDSYTTGGASVVLPNVGTLARSGYTFDGWNTSAAGTGTNYAAADNYTTVSNVIFYAKWNPVTYSITYNGNTSDGGSAPTTGGYTTGQASPYSVLANTFTKTSNVFGGWNTAANGTGTSYSPGATITTLVNIVLYATWIPQFTLHYAINGGSVTSGSLPADQLYNTGTSVGPVFSSVSRTGYTFGGWLNGATTIAANGNFTILADSVLTAKWTPINYTISYNSDGGTEAPSSITKQIGQSYTVGAAVSKPGYNFTGWSNGSSVVGAGATIVTGSSDVTYTAQWVARVYTISFDWNGGRGTAVADVNYTFGTTAITLPLVGDRVRDGYTFAGWSESLGGSALASTYTPSQTRTLYALWNIGNFTVTYDAGRGTIANSTVSVTNGGNTVLPLPTRANFTFNGWHTAVSGGSSVGSNGATFTPTSSQTIYARWIQNSLYGITDSLTRIGSVVTVANVANTFSGANSNSSVAVSIPANALPAGTTINFDLVGSSTRATGIITGINYLVSIALSWLTGDETVPDTASDKPISVTISNATIKAGAAAYAIVNNVSTLLGTATQDGVITVAITADPEIVVAAVKPGAPTNVAATSNGNQQSVISWSAPASDGGSAITGYTVTASPGAGTCTTSTTSCTISSLTNGTAYTFTVTATNAVGTSVASTSASATTAALYAVTFDAKGGSTVTSGSFLTASTVSEPTAPTRTGYSFTGWSAIDGGSAVTFPYAPGVTTAITLYARWDALDNAVTFDSKSGSDVTASVFSSGGTVAEPTAPTRSGYTFAGWSATDGGTAVTFPYAPGVVTDITLYAKWTVVSQNNSSGSGGGSSTPAPSVPSEPVVPSTPVKSNVTVVAPVTVVGDQDAKVIAVDIATPAPGSNTKPPAIKVDKASEKFIAEVKVVEGKLVLTPETGFSGKKTVTVTITENGADRIVQIPLTVLPEAVTKPVLTPTASNRSLIRWTESPNADGYTVFLNGKRVCTTAALSCSVKTILGPDANIEIVSNGGDRTVSQRVDAEFRQNVPVPITRLVSATITKATLTRVDTKALDQVVALIKNQGFGTVVISEITTTSKTKALAAARIESIKKYITSKIGTEEVEFEITPVKSRTYFNNISVKG